MIGDLRSENGQYFVIEQGTLDNHPLSAQLAFCSSRDRNSLLSELPILSNAPILVAQRSVKTPVLQSIDKLSGQWGSSAPHAQGDPLSDEQRANIVEHLTGCGECRDLVLFIRKTNATLLYEGRVSRVAKALRMSTETLEHEIKSGTSVAALLQRPPEAPVSPKSAPVQPLSPAKK